MAMSVGPSDSGEDTPMSDINTTPLVDVMLVLLIIFLITVPITLQSVPVQLPKVEYEVTVTKPENYGPDFKGIHDEYSKYLSPAEIKHWHRERKKEQGQAKVMKAWQALRWEGPKAARAKAIDAVKHQVTSLDAWRVMYCALRGH